MNYNQRESILATKQKLDISIVIPLKNEAGNIPNLVKEIIEKLSSSQTHVENFEILLIDDGSDDNSKEIIDAIVAENQFIVAIYHQHNYGQSRAIHSGVTHSQYEWIITMDGDGQNDPVDISKLIATLLAHQQSKPEENRLVIIGQRRLRHDSHLKRLSSYLANTIRRHILNDYTRDTGCSLKLFKRQDFLQLPFFDHMHRFFPALFQRHGLHIVSVSVNHRPRLSGYSKYGLWDRLWVGIVDMIGVYWLMHRYKIPKIKTGLNKMEE